MNVVGVDPRVLGLVRDRSVTLGVLSVFVHQYLREDADEPGPTVPGLRVWSLSSDEVALYHRAAALYGFLRLSHLDNPHRLHLVDPTGHWLPRACVVADVPDRALLRDALAAGATPPDGAPWAAPIRARTLPLYPSVDCPVVPGETVIWGALRDPAGQPAPFARVEVQTASQTVVGYSDLQGSYLVRLRGERATFVVPEAAVDDDLLPEDDGLPELGDDDESPAELTDRFDFTVRFWRLRQPPRPGQDPLRAFPADFDQLGADPLALDAAYRPSAPADQVLLRTRIGVRNRLDHDF